MKKKRILVFNDALVLAGTEKLLVELVNYLSQSAEVTLLLPMAVQENVLLSSVSDKVTVAYLYSSSSSYFERKLGHFLMLYFTPLFLKFKKIREKDFDEVICFKEGFFAKIFSNFKIPKHIWFHNILYRHKYDIHSFKERMAVWLNKQDLRITRNSYKKYDHVFCVSQACKKSYLDVVFNGKSPIQKIEVLYNPIDVDLIRRLAMEDSCLNYKESVFNFILLTRVSSDKRLDRLFKLVDELIDRGITNFHIHVLGITQDDCQAYASSFDVLSFISFYGQVTNPYPAIKQSDCMLCISERESFSLSLLEALYLNVPVVSTDCGGPREILEDGKLGILTPNTTIGLSEIIASVLWGNQSLIFNPSDKLSNKYDKDAWLQALKRSYLD